MLKWIEFILTQTHLWHDISQVEILSVDFIIHLSELNWPEIAIIERICLIIIIGI